MEMDILKSDYEAIEKLIGCDASPVGIDAKKTHILILHKLGQIEERLGVIESRLLKCQ